MTNSVTIVLEYLNTLDLTHGHDSLASPGHLSVWLREHARSDLDVGLQDVAWAVEFREALRSMISRNSGGDFPPAAAEVIDRAARAASLSLRLPSEGGSTLVPQASGLAGVVASVLASVHAAISGGIWPRIKICRNPECRRAFYDRSRNRSRVWCEMAACGNRMKARRFRQRGTGSEDR